MKKYIDAEKLRKLLANRYEEITVPVITDEGGLESFYRRSEIHNIFKIIDSLQQEQDLIIINKKDWEAQEQFRKNKDFGKPLQQERQEVDLEKFTEKMDAWKARYNYPDNIIVRGAMAFTARMFYMYPEVAREWYDSLRKVTMD